MVHLCTFRGCKRERSLADGSQGRCCECWQEDEEHEEYQKKWYEYWDARGKNFTVFITPRRYAV